VFKAAGKRPVALVQPTHTPNTQALAYWGIPVSSFMVVRPKNTADALWAVEQILRAGTCSAVVFWQQTVRPEALRRLHVVAQSSDSLLFVLRPEYAVRDSSPAPLRLGLKPSPDGLIIDFIKRRGPQRAEPLVLPLSPSPVLLARRPTAVVRRLGRPSRTVPAQEPAKVFVLHE
jgi:protein ImuA